MRKSLKIWSPAIPLHDDEEAGSTGNHLKTTEIQKQLSTLRMKEKDKRNENMKTVFYIVS